MKVVIVSVGSRGDIEPFCALAQGLLDDGHQVDYALQTAYQHLVPSGVKLHSLPFTSNDFYKFTNPTHGADHPNTRVPFIGVVADVIGELVLPCWETVLEAARDCNAIVSSSLARSLSIAIAKNCRYQCI